MQACCVRQHSRNFVHKVATNVFLAPDQPIAQCLPHSLQHQGLFNGNVPQPKDWLRPVVPHRLLWLLQSSFRQMITQKGDVAVWIGFVSWPQENMYSRVGLLCLLL